MTALVLPPLTPWSFLLWVVIGCACAIFCVLTWSVSMSMRWRARAEKERAILAGRLAESDRAVADYLSALNQATKEMTELSNAVRAAQTNKEEIQ